MREGWVEVRIKDVGKTLSGGTPKTVVREYWGDDFAWITPADLSGYTKKYISKGRKSITSKGLEKSSAKLMPAGSILFSSRAPIGYTVIASNELSTNQGFKSIIPFSILESEYVYYYLKSSKQLAEKNASGTTFKELSGKAFSELPIPLAPLPEQRAIVAKIEQLFSELDNGIRSFKTAQEQLKTYRQAVLKKAFEGELTKEWRANQTNLPTADELLQQIKEEREKHYNQQLQDWKQAIKDWEANGKVGKRPNKPRKATEISDLTETELKELPILPNSMVWTRLGNILWSVKDGPHYSPKYSETGIPFISGGNIRPNGINFENVKYISKELHQELSKRCKPEINDILYTKGGTTGIARVNTYNLDFNVWVHVAVLKAIDIVLPFYLQHVLNSNHCYKQSQTYTHGVGNQDLGLTRMILITVPICSKAEQHQIVQEIESRLSVCDKLEESIQESLLKAEALRQSILKQAFEGKLLSEAELAATKKEADWEPAEVLLRRIEKEKNLVAKKKK